MAEEVTILYCLSRGHLDDVPIDKLNDFQNEFRRFISASHPEVLDAITEQKQLTPEIEEQLKSTIGEFKQSSQFAQS